MNRPISFALGMSSLTSGALVAIDALAIAAYVLGVPDTVPSLVGLSAAAAGCGSAALWSRADLDRADRASNQGGPTFAGITGILTGATAMISSATAPALAYGFSAALCLLGLALAALAAWRAHRTRPDLAAPKPSPKAPQPPDAAASTSTYSASTPAFAYGCAAALGLVGLAFAFRAAQRASRPRPGQVPPPVHMTSAPTLDAEPSDAHVPSDATRNPSAPSQAEPRAPGAGSPAGGGAKRLPPPP